MLGELRKAGANRLAIGMTLGLLASQSLAAPTRLEYVEQTLSVDGVEQTVSIPAGYRMEALVSDLGAPRLLTFGEDGELFIGSQSGEVYRLRPPYDKAELLLTLRGYPHSLARRKGELLIARTNGLYRITYQPGEKDLKVSDIGLLAPVPGGGGHNSRTVGIGPDGRVYLSLGIQGNCTGQYLGVSVPFEHRRGGVMVLDESHDPPRWEPFASGLRNPVGFDWHPVTGVAYASNNGPDHLGFELPPEYFSKLEPGSFHGMPWYQYDGDRVRLDPCRQSGPPHPAAEVSLPVATFPARSAPMGVAFVPEGALEQRLVGDAIVALRGSWGTLPSGGPSGDPATRRHPKLVLVRFQDGEAMRVDDLVTGFQREDGRRWARPVGVAIGPDGWLYFTSDSGANALFRLRPD